MGQTPLELALRVSLGDDASPDETDWVARNLRLELLDAGVAEAELPTTAAPLGAKAGTGSIIGDIALAVLPAVLPKVIDLLVDWRKRSEGRSIKVSAQVDGAPIEITLDGRGADADAAVRLLDKLRNPASRPTIAG